MPVETGTEDRDLDSSNRQGTPAVKSDNNTIWVNAFNEESAKKFTEGVYKAAETNSKKPIIVNIDSYGGYVDALATMLGVMDSVPNPVITVCHGKAMSCGAILLSHGDKRFVTPHGRVMIHEVSSGTSGNVQDIKVDVAETDRLNTYMMTLLAKNCGKTFKQLQALFAKKRDIYMTPEEAVKFKIADKIGIPEVKLTTTYLVG